MPVTNGDIVIDKHDVRAGGVELLLYHAVKPVAEERRRRIRCAPLAPAPEDGRGGMPSYPKAHFGAWRGTHRQAKRQELKKDRDVSRRPWNGQEL